MHPNLVLCVWVHSIVLNELMKHNFLAMSTRKMNRLPVGLIRDT